MVDRAVLLATLVDDARDAAIGDWALLGSGDAMVNGIAFDSRAVKAGDLFVCVTGGHTDGHLHAPAALAAGAVGVVVERILDLDAPQVLVPDTRAAMGWLAATFFGSPSRHLQVAAVTGTNGKTTVTNLLATVLGAAGIPAVAMGTLTGTRTTPEAPLLQAELARHRDSGVAAVAMEVSSHAIEQHRIDGTWFEVGVFTNLSPEHLDYHGDLERYFATKAALFVRDRVRRAVVNAADPWGERLLAMFEGPAVAVHPDQAEALHLDRRGADFVWRGQPVRLMLPGRFNVTNALLAAEAAVALGLEPAAVASGLRQARPVRGRIEVVVDQPGAPLVIVDYAHTPDGLEQVLDAVAEVAGPGRLLVVFGCGGDRDRTKRPLMGRAVAARADIAFVTSDNPRSEDPMAIIAEALAGMAGLRAEVVVEPDRRTAIKGALSRAGEGDVVVVAGKGHETTQTIGDRVLPFDDRAVVRELLALPTEADPDPDRDPDPDPRRLGGGS